MLLFALFMVGIFAIEIGHKYGSYVTYLIGLSFVGLIFGLTLGWAKEK